MLKFDDKSKSISNKNRQPSKSESRCDGFITFKTPKIRVNLLQWVLDRRLNDKTYSKIFIVIITIGVYFLSLFNGFQMLWDDQWMVYNSYTSIPLNVKNVYKIFSEYYGGQYGPVNQLYYCLIYKISGYDPFWFHLGSLTLHVLNAILVYNFTYRILCVLLEQCDNTKILRVTFFATLLFAIHPFNVESVSWISSSKVVLFAFFYLISLKCYIDFIHSKKLWSYIQAILFFLLSFFSKEQAIILPLSLLIIDYVFKRNLLSSAVWIEKLAFFILAIIFGLITIQSQNSIGGGVLSDSENYQIHYNIAFGFYSLFQYVLKCVAPVNLSYLYPFPILQGSALPYKYWMPMLNFILLLPFSKYFLQYRWAIFCVAFFTSNLLLVLHIIPMARIMIIADRYVYLSSIAVFIAISIGLNYISELSRNMRRISLILAFSYIAFLLHGTYNRAIRWENDESLKKDLNEFIKNKDEL
jgi:hypothetical protein